MFKFADLSAEAKATAIDANRYVLVVDNFWSEFLVDDFVEELENIGFRDVEINWSGFSSQGDGASFTSGWINIEKFLRSQKCFSKFRRYMPNGETLEYSAKIERHNGSRYYHENSVYVSDSWDVVNTDKQEAMIHGILDIIGEFVKCKSREIYRELEKAHDANTTDEAIADFLENNEYIFDEDGEMI